MSWSLSHFLGPCSLSIFMLCICVYLCFSQYADWCTNRLQAKLLFPQMSESTQTHNIYIYVKESCRKCVSANWACAENVHTHTHSMMMEREFMPQARHSGMKRLLTHILIMEVITEEVRIFYSFRVRIRFGHIVVRIRVNAQSVWTEHQTSQGILASNCSLHTLNL